MVEKLERVRRIFDSKIKMHLIVILKLQAEIAILDEVVAPVFIETVKFYPLKTMLIQPDSRRLVYAIRTPCYY